METLNMSDGKPHPGHRFRGLCATWDRYVVWMKRRPVFAFILLALAWSVLCSAIGWVVLHKRFTHPTELKPFPESDSNHAEFPKPPSDKMISYIRHTAPKKFQDISVPLNETAHGQMDILAAYYLLNGLNASVDPCEDFYEFACGNKAYGKMTDGHYKDTAFLLRNMAQAILENWNATSSHSRPMNLAAEFYNQCLDETEFDNWTESAYKILNSLGGWPSIDNHWSAEKFEFLNSLANARRIYGHSPFFNVFVCPHPKNQTRNAICLDRPTFTIPEEIIAADVVNDTAMDAYRAQYVHALGQISGLDDPGFHDDVNEVFNLERRLTMAAAQGYDIDPSKLLKVEQFQLEMDKIHVNTSQAQIIWIHLLNDIFQSSGATVKPDQDMVVTDINFVKKLLKILDTTTPRTLANYMQWTLVRRWLPLLSKNTSAAHSNFSSILGIVEEDNLEGAELASSCLKETMSLFVMPLCKEFVRRQYFPHSIRTAVYDMTTALRETLVEIIRENGWIGDISKANALAKADGMKQLVGYPDWITNDTILEDKFKNLKFGNDQVDNLASFLQWLSDSNLNTLNWDGVDLWMLPAVTGVQNMRTTSTSMLSPHKEAFVMESTPPLVHYISPFDVNAFHWSGHNSILIPMGIAVPPFYFSLGPAYVNYGKLGRTIGHEIAHGFDSTGIKYDADGNLRDWLSPEDQEKFEEKAKCFVEQYNEFEVLPGKRINGSFTLDENIADNLGLELAYRGYKRSVQDGQVEQPQKLFGLEKLSPEQLFFLSYATSKCEAPAAPETLERMLLIDNHSPNKYRVIGALQNSKEFAQAWECPLGSHMNPKAKCAQW